MKTLLAFVCRRLLLASPVFRGCARCPDRPGDISARRAGFPGAPFPVDIVYTWVDGKEPALAAKRERYLPEEEKRSPLFQGSALYSDNEELRYSLRSVEQYAPWARRIFIVTDGQVPGWLNTAHEKIRIIDHGECIPHAYLPTFNSHVIEAYLHRIPGLSERYIYCNDDFFFLSPCRPEDFFTPNGLPYIFLDWRYSRRRGYATTDTPHARSYANTRAYMRARGFCPDPGLITAHAPYAQNRENAAQGFLFFEEPIRAFSYNRFRTREEMAFYCHALPHWSYYAKKAVPLNIPFFYVNTVRYDRKVYYETILREKDQGVLPCFLCLNDAGEPCAGDARHEDMRRFLKAFYPAPSAFER